MANQWLTKCPAEFLVIIILGVTWRGIHPAEMIILKVPDMACYFLGYCVTSFSWTAKSRNPWHSLKLFGFWVRLTAASLYTFWNQLDLTYRVIYLSLHGAFLMVHFWVTILTIYRVIYLNGHTMFIFSWPFSIVRFGLEHLLNVTCHLLPSVSSARFSNTLSLTV